MNDPQVLYGFLGLLAFLAYYVWVAASLSAVFAKAGEEGWKGWVPILNLVTLVRLGGFSGWLVLLFLIPFGGLVVIGLAAYRVNTSFGHGAGMTVLAVLLFPVWTSILGWGSARWLGSERAPQSGPMRRGDATSLDARVAAPSSYVVPPRPPDPVADAHDPAFLPTTRSSARAAAAAAAASVFAEDDTDLPRGRSHAPYTGTTPTSTPPAPASAPQPAEPRRAFAPAEHDPDEPFVSPAAGRSVPEPPAPVRSVPAVPETPAVDPWAPPPPRPTRYSPAPTEDAHFGDSAEVSAVVGAPTMGAPRSARESVAAQHGEPELPDAEGAFDETILTARRRTAWMLTPPLGAPLAVTSDVLIIGRRPGFDPDFADAQLVPISDETRTMSKTHARLELQGEIWMIVDLDSTNGVILVAEDGTEVDATPGVPERVTERFLLGDAELRLTRADAE